MMKFVVMLLLAALIAVALKFCDKSEAKQEVHREPLKKNVESVALKAKRLTKIKTPLFKVRQVTFKKPKVKKKTTLRFLDKTQIHELNKALQQKEKEGGALLRRMANEIKSSSSEEEQLALYYQAKKVLEIQVVNNKSVFKDLTTSLGEVMNDYKGWIKWSSLVIFIITIGNFLLFKFIKGRRARGIKDILTIMAASAVLVWSGEISGWFLVILVGIFFALPRIINFVSISPD